MLLEQKVGLHRETIPIGCGAVEFIGDIGVHRVDQFRRADLVAGWLRRVELEAFIDDSPGQCAADVSTNLPMAIGLAHPAFRRDQTGLSLKAAEDRDRQVRRFVDGRP